MVHMPRFCEFVCTFVGVPCYIKLSSPKPHGKQAASKRLRVATGNTPSTLQETRLVHTGQEALEITSA